MIFKQLFILGIVVGCGFSFQTQAFEPYVPPSPDDIAPRYGYFTAEAETTHNAAAIHQGEVAASMIDALQVAKNYVEILDSGKYEDSWKSGDKLLQGTVTAAGWSQALTDARAPLGAVKLRKLKDEKPAWDPQGLPQGAYMVVEYDTSFANAPDSGEVLTLRKGPDGKWRVVTYQVN